MRRLNVPVTAHLGGSCLHRGAAMKSFPGSSRYPEDASAQRKVLNTLGFRTEAILRGRQSVFDAHGGLEPTVLKHHRL